MEQKENARKLGEAFDKIRADVQRRGIPEMSLEEINAIIKEVREERRRKRMEEEK
jgi:hypothetical protein